MRTILGTMIRMLLSIVVFVCAFTVTYAQLFNDNRAKYGLFVHGAYNLHAADFKKLPGIACCSPGFSDGGGFGFDIGLMGSLPLADQWLVSLRAGYATYGGKLETDESRTVSLFGEAVPGTFRHTIDATVPALTFDILAGFRPANRLTILVGPTIALAMSPTFDQREDLILPEVGTFEDSTRTRLDTSGPIPGSKSFMPAITFGLSYDIPLDANHTWYLIPEAMFSLGLTNIADSVTWKVSRIRVGVAVAYSPPDVRPITSTDKILNGEIAAAGLEADGTERPRVTLRIEEFLSTRMKPILPYVFFDDGSADIPARYKRRSEASVATFRELDLHNASMLGTYHDLLNIIGRRLQDMPSATIAITGCTSGEGADARRSDVGMKRAEALKSYIVNTWRIQPGRISTTSRALPEVPSNVTEADGVEENRRAEITASDLRVLDPIWTTDTSRAVNPPGIRFRGDASAEAGLDEWRINVSQEGRAVKDFAGQGALPEIVDWDVEGDQQFVPRAPSQLDYSLYLKDHNGKEHVSKGRPLNVEQITIQYKRRERIKDKEIDRYALIAFEYADSKVTAQQARLLDRLKERVSLASTIRISGHTDRTGETAFNQKLSDERATNVAAYLKGGTMSASGYGELGAPYNNFFPEGRFYNRTVNIVVENPLKE